MNRPMHISLKLSNGAAARGIDTCVGREKWDFAKFSPIHIGAAATQ